MNIKKGFIALCVSAALTIAPMGCASFPGAFVNVTDKIGHSLATINVAYGALELMLEAAVKKNLPDADRIAEMLQWLEAVRDEIANAPVLAANADKADAAAGVAVKLVKQAEEVVK